ncbi:NADH:flavin oxidoreductase [Planctomycetota bacterium]
MVISKDILFSPLELRNITLPNRFIRSATYEGWGDSNGYPRLELSDLYIELALGGIGTLVTGFVYPSQAGRAMQSGQCGIDTDDKILSWRQITAKVRETNPQIKLFMQLAHAGRQTLQVITGFPVVGASSRKCSYFKQRVKILDEKYILQIIDEFAAAAFRAKEAAFDGVQIHAAHGYLIHQFLSPWTNTRKDCWANGTLFLEKVICAIRGKCGQDFPILVKLSAVDDNTPGLRLENAITTVKCLEKMDIDAVEISYGTMEYALNIIRGAVPVDLVLKVNPMFNRMPKILLKIWKALFLKRYLKRFIPFSENYNVEAAAKIKKETLLPVIPVGGIRTLASMVDCLNAQGLDAVSLCRPLIREPDIPLQIEQGTFEKSKCSNCNLCTVNCDSQRTLRCYKRKKE